MCIERCGGNLCHAVQLHPYSFSSRSWGGWLGFLGHRHDQSLAANLFAHSLGLLMLLLLAGHGADGADTTTACPSGHHRHHWAVCGATQAADHRCGAGRKSIYHLYGRAHHRSAESLLVFMTFWLDCCNLHNEPLSWAHLSLWYSSASAWISFQRQAGPAQTPRGVRLLVLCLWYRLYDYLIPFSCVSSGGPGPMHTFLAMSCKTMGHQQRKTFFLSLLSYQRLLMCCKKSF